MQAIAFAMGFPENIVIEGIFALLMDSITASTPSIKWRCETFKDDLRKEITQRMITPAILPASILQNAQNGPEFTIGPFKTMSLVSIC